MAALALKKDHHPIAMNLNVVKGFRSSEIKRWAGNHLEPGNLVNSDGLACFPPCSNGVSNRYSIVTGGGQDSVTKKEFAWVNTMIGNLKRSINGTYHANNPIHLPRYLAAFCYRFNRRFDLQAMMPSFLVAVTIRRP